MEEKLETKENDFHEKKSETFASYMEIELRGLNLPVEKVNLETNSLLNEVLEIKDAAKCEDISQEPITDEKEVSIENNVPGVNTNCLEQEKDTTETTSPVINDQEEKSSTNETVTLFKGSKKKQGYYTLRFSFYI